MFETSSRALHQPDGRISIEHKLDENDSGIAYFRAELMMLQIHPIGARGRSMLHRKAFPLILLVANLVILTYCLLISCVPSQKLQQQSIQ